MSFENLTRRKARFSSVRGELTLEQLWELPLISVTGLSLNDVGKGINRALKEVDEESLVENVNNKAVKDLTEKLDAVKYIINVKQEENKALPSALPQEHWTVQALIVAINALTKAGNDLAFKAETSCGVAGRDEPLCDAIAHWAAERSKILEAIADKDDKALSKASKTELLEKLAKLDEDEE